MVGTKGALGPRWGTRRGKGSGASPEVTEERAQLLPGPAPSPLPARGVFSGLRAWGLHPLFTPTGEARPGGEASLPGAAEHPADPAAEGGGSAGGHQVAPTPSPHPDFICLKLRLFNAPQLSGRAGVKSSPTCPFTAFTLGPPLQILDRNHPSRSTPTHINARGTHPQAP